jgi:segregation and condensation protein B
MARAKSRPAQIESETTHVEAAAHDLAAGAESSPPEVDAESHGQDYPVAEGEADAIELDPTATSMDPDEDLVDAVLTPAERPLSAALETPAQGPEGDESAPSGPGPGDLLTDEELLHSVTALVFASPEPISLRRLVDLLERPATRRVEAALVVVAERLAQSGLPLELRRIAGGHQILTTPAMGSTIQRLFKARKAERISGAALETLAVIAYRQPVTKAEIEAIRGVQAGPMLRTLVERGLARVTGRADVPGHPLQYGTTRDFLDRFGLGSLEELPRDTELSKD